MWLKEIEGFLEEDLGCGDYEEIAPEGDCKAEITVEEEEGVLAGLEEVKRIFDYFSIQYSSKFEDGDKIKRGDVIIEIKGNSSNILKSERCVLNFLGRMSGIATLTNAFVNEVKKVNAEVSVAGTRKTTPGFRKYEKKAITIGEGDCHRCGLYDARIIKDNHIKLLGIENAIKKSKEKTSFARKIEVEVENIEDAIKAAELKVDIIMLDNMRVEDVMEYVELLKERKLRDNLILEVSGKITLENIADYASTGIDVISTGMLTHSA